MEYLDNPWTLNGEPFDMSLEEIQDAGWYSFTYIMTSRDTGQKYIGKKLLISKRKLPPLKGKTRKRIIYKDSGWRKYWSSSKVVQGMIDGGDIFDREIIALHVNKRNANIHELQLQILYNCLDAEDKNGQRIFLNENISMIYYPVKDRVDRAARIKLFKEMMSEAQLLLS